MDKFYLRLIRFITMPHCCSVPNCKGNYRNGPKVTVFSFPKDPELVQKWIRAIKRDFVPTLHSRVCKLSSVIIVVH